jgi:hypothetical protein
MLVLEAQLPPVEAAFPVEAQEDYLAEEEAVALVVVVADLAVAVAMVVEEEEAVAVAMVVEVEEVVVASLVVEAVVEEVAEAEDHPA